VIDITVDAVDTAATVPGPLTGRGQPGAAVTAVSSEGARLGAATVAADGRWTLVLDIDQLDRSSTVRAAQSIDGVEQSASAAVGPYVLPTPDVSGVDGRTIELTDEDRDGAEDDAIVVLSGAPGEGVVVAVDGRSSGTVHTLAAGSIRRYIPNLALGVHEIEIRYIDEDTGLLGWPLRTTIVVVPARVAGP
jgi:hypothetical protein